MDDIGLHGVQELTEQLTGLGIVEVTDNVAAGGGCGKNVHRSAGGARQA